MFKYREYLRREREVELARQGLEPRAILFAKAARGIAPSDEHAAVHGAPDGVGHAEARLPHDDVARPGPRLAAVEQQLAPQATEVGRAPGREAGAGDGRAAGVGVVGEAAARLALRGLVRVQSIRVEFSCAVLQLTDIQLVIPMVLFWRLGSSLSFVEDLV